MITNKLGLFKSAQSFSALAILWIVVLSSASASAALVGQSVEIYLESNGKAGSFTLPNPGPGVIDYAWNFNSTGDDGNLSPPAPMPVTAADGSTLAYINKLSVDYADDPHVLFNFEITNDNPSVMHVMFSSASVGFTPLFHPTASATAGITVTDFSGSGAYANGSLGPLVSNTSYQAEYDNGSSIVPFADLVSPITTPVNRTVTGQGSNPINSFDPDPTIFDTVNSIHSKFEFDLSPNASASGTSAFIVTSSGLNAPEPSSFLLAGLGLMGLVVAARRRRFSRAA